MDSETAIEETTAFRPAYNADGLLPCITVDAQDGTVLMMAWMNEAALKLTLETGIAHYWSRSRKEMWKKGETSGAIQHVIAASIDCDQDTLLLTVRPEKIEQTCHTGRSSCFYRTITKDPDQPSGMKLILNDHPDG